MSLLSTDSAGDRWRKRKAALCEAHVHAHDTFDPDQPRDPQGKWASSFVVREHGQNIGAERLSELSRPGHFYRGMSEAEYKATISSGRGIVSNLSSSIASAEGTNFAEDVPTAESYANFGRDDPRLTGKPNYLVEVKGGNDIVKKPDSYYHSRAEVPRDRITRAWRMEAEGKVIHAYQVIGDAVHVHDASPRPRDPTSTGPLRGKFRNDLDRRWARLRVLVREAISQANILNLGPPTISSIANVAAQHGPLPGVDKVQGFSRWIEEAMRQIVLGGQGEWAARYVDDAVELATQRAEHLVGRVRKINAVADQRSQHLGSWAEAELRGICDAVSQQAVRAAAQCIMLRKRPAAVARAVCDRINAIGRTRSRQMADHVVVKSFSLATLDAYRAMGISHVGIVPEHLPKIEQTKHGKTFARDAKRRRKVDLDVVEVLTAGDDQVCELCQDISDDGPYTLDDAEELIPAHINCRCGFIPADDARFASVHEED